MFDFTVIRAWLKANASKVAMGAALVLAAFVLLTMSNCAHAAPVITKFTATPAGDIAPADVTLSWATTGASACTASGGWSGTKAASGTEVIAGAKSGTTTFSLVCSEGAGALTVTWTPAAKNTDGTDLTNLAGYKIYWGTSPTSMLDVIPVAGAASSYTHSGLAAGTYYYALATLNLQGVESAKTGTVNGTVALASTAPSNAPVTLKAQPLPPTNVKVATTTSAYELRSYSNGTFRMVKVGTVTKGAACGPDLAGGYALIDGAKITKPTQGGAITTLCASPPAGA